MECFWNKISEYELKELRRASGGVAMIPLASIESHGPHLPLGCDTHIVNYVVEQLVKEETVAVLPTVEYSDVDAARALPGAVHLRSDLLMAMVENICDEIYRNGFEKIILFHGHGGNVFLHSAFAKRMLELEKPYAIYSITAMAGASEAIAALVESAEYGHAGEMETSMLMAIAPDLVNLAVLGDKTFPTQPAPDTLEAWTQIDWIVRHPEMAVGEPQKATRAKGEKMLKHWIDSSLDILRRIKSDQLVLQSIKDYRKRANSIAE